MFNFIQKLKNIQIPFLSFMNLYFDLGTETTRIAIKDKGIVLREPSYIGYNSKIKEYIFFGQEAKTILGKTPDFVRIIRPVVNGILSDFDGEIALISNFLDRSVQPYMAQYKIVKPTFRAMGCIPSIATEIEQKAVEEALVKVGCNEVTLVEKAIATSAGCGFDIFSHKPRFVIDLGAGLIELSIVSGGGIVVQKSLKTAGESMNKLIGNYLYLKHGIVLGDRTCEELKKELLDFTQEDKTTTVRGKSLETGLPKSIRVKTSDIKEALQNSLNHIIDSAKELMESSPPEIADEVYNHGITLTGAMASAPGIDKFISRELKIDAYIAEHYQDATIHGLINLDKNRENVHRLIGYK